MKSIYTPNDFKHLNTDSEMIQAAVDEAAKYGASVTIPRYNERRGECVWVLDETILLYSGSYVTLENCHIRLADDTYIRFFENSSARADVEWYKKNTRQHDITLVGMGNALLDGGNHNGVFESDFSLYDDNGNFVKRINYRGLGGIFVNRGVQFRNVERVTVKGLRFVNQRYWAMSFEFCSFGHVSDIFFDAQNNVPNQDGIDIRVGCNNFLVENITGFVGDDTVAITNFGTLENTDMDRDIHDIIVKNIHSFETGRCDIIRLLNRGGARIYNVQISNVVDLTGEWGEKRPLAAVRIGDLNDYPFRLNEPGEIRNITVRDVITRARFGVYVANTLVDSVFDNIMMTADGGIGMYFNGCYLENVYINKLLYGIGSNPPESDVGYRHLSHRVNITRLSALYLNNSTVKNFNVENVHAAGSLPYVFDGNTSIEIKARSITVQNEKTLLAPENIKLVDR